MIRRAILASAIDQLVLRSGTIEAVCIGQKGIDIVCPMSINTIQLPIIPRSNNEQTTDIRVTVGTCTNGARYPLLHKIPQSFGWVSGRMCFAFKPLALDIRLNEEAPIVGGVYFGGLATHVLISSVTGNYTKTSAKLLAGLS
jgi:hypothetical protein